VPLAGHRAPRVTAMRATRPSLRGVVCCRIPGLAPRRPAPLQAMTRHADEHLGEEAIAARPRVSAPPNRCRGAGKPLNGGPFLSAPGPGMYKRTEAPRVARARRIVTVRCPGRRTGHAKRQASDRPAKGSCTPRTSAYRRRRQLAPRTGECSAASARKLTSAASGSASAIASASARMLQLRTHRRRASRAGSCG
jgi:hypothetical protein